MSNILYFNPTCEMAIANGTVSWQPNRMLKQFETDLELIIAFVAKENDTVLLRKRPSTKHLQKLENLGFKIPKIKQVDEALADPLFCNITNQQIQPWGWSPAFVNQFKTISTNYKPLKSFITSTKWDKETKALFSRITAKRVLQNILYTNLPETVSMAVLPQTCHSANDLIKHHKNFGTSIIKAPWSSSGRGIQIIDRSEIHPSILNWCNGMLKEQGYLMIEPLLNKKLDFAFQFEIKEDAVEYLGTSWFSTNKKNAYAGNYLKKELAPIPKIMLDLLSNSENLLVDQLTKELTATYLGKYKGKAGIDAMFVLNPEDKLLIHPCVEINLRTNMGNVAMALSPFTHHGYSAFEIGTIQDYRKKDQSKTLLLTEGERFCAYLV